MANPFDDDIDDGKLYGGSKYTKSPAAPEEDFNFYERQIEQIMQSTLESSTRSVLLLEESEKIGTATAQDLLVQGEKLQKVEKQLDEINATTKQTQKHLNNIKSVFGGIKNYFSKSSAQPTAPVKENEQPRKLETVVTKMNSSSSGTGFNEKDSQSSNMSKSMSGSHSLSDSSRAAIAGTRWGAMDDQIDENLDLMSANLRNLRELGSALGSEIDEQNQRLDDIAKKADKADTEIRQQDKQMRRILGGKPKQAPTDSNSTSGKEKGGK